MTPEKYENLIRRYIPEKGKGRIKGTKNADKIYLNGELVGKVNQYGVEFTLDELEKLRQAVNSVKRKAKNLKAKNNYESLILGQDEYGKLRSDRDYLFATHSYSMAQFKTKEAYHNYMERLERMKKRNYVKDVINDMKERYAKSIENGIGNKKMANHIRTMSDVEFSVRVGMGVFEQITFMYNPDDYDSMVAKVKNRMGYGEGSLQVDLSKYEKKKPKQKKQTKKKGKKGKKWVLCV